MKFEISLHVSITKLFTWFTCIVVFVPHFWFISFALERSKIKTIVLKRQYIQYICIYTYIYTYIYIYIFNINLHMLHNSFDNQGSKMQNKSNDIFDVSGYCLLRKVLSHYTFNKCTSWYQSSCIRLCSQLTLGILITYVLNP